MATLSQTIGSLSVGTHDVLINMLGWHKVGSCDISANAAFAFAATGSYSALGKSGNFDVQLTLDDRDSSSAAGPCTIVNSGTSLAGTYELNATTLTFSDGEHTVTVSPDRRGVILAVSGYPKALIAT